SAVVCIGRPLCRDRTLCSSIYGRGICGEGFAHDRIEMKRCATAFAHLLARTRRPEAAHAAHCKTPALAANCAGFTGTLVRCSRRNISARKVTSVPEWDRQFRLVRVHHEHREELGRLRLAGLAADAVEFGLHKES